MATLAWGSRTVAALLPDEARSSGRDVRDPRGPGRRSLALSVSRPGGGASLAQLVWRSPPRTGPAAKFTTFFVVLQLTHAQPKAWGAAPVERQRARPPR